MGDDRNDSILAGKRLALDVAPQYMTARHARNPCEQPYHDGLDRNRTSVRAPLSAGIEYLQGLSDTGIYRVNSDVGVTANLWKSLGISFTFGERYESKPLPGKKTRDTTTAVSLVCTLI